jgi:hypothetical protein
MDILRMSAYSSLAVVNALALNICNVVVIRIQWVTIKIVCHNCKCNSRKAPPAVSKNLYK